MYIGGGKPSSVGSKTRRGGASRIDGPQREPNQDLRSTLAKLEASAMQLNAGGDMRVMRNLDSVCEVSRRMRQDTSRYSSGGDSQASVELFMASVGFNVQEQQRLLQQITASRAAAVDDVVPPTSGNGDGGADGTPQDLDSFLAKKRSEALMRAVEDVHRVIVDREREESEDFVSEIWERRKADLATTMGMRTFASAGGPSDYHRGDMNQSLAAGGGSTFLDQSGVGIGYSGGSQSGAMPALSAQRIAEFTRIVATSPSSSWLAKSTDCVLQDPKASDQVKQNWLSVDKMLSPIVNGNGGSNQDFTGGDFLAGGSRGGSSMQPHPSSSSDLAASPNATVLTLVSSSRGVLEQQYLHRVLKETVRVRDDQLAEYAKIHATKLRDLIAQYCSSQIQAAKDPSRPYAKQNHTWSETYIAMRCGRYDVAALVAPDRSVAKALQEVADQQPNKRNNFPPHDHLVDVYSREETRNDPYRAACLVILLAGRVGTSNEATETLIDQILPRVIQYPEDILWFRMTMVRTAQSFDDRSPKVQSLAEMQEHILQGQEQLTSMVGGDRHKVINILLHALLPSTALRLLMHEDGCFLDGVQLALIYDSLNFLTCTAAERPIDLDQVLQKLGHFALNASRPTSVGQSTSATTGLFSYFSKTNRVRAFVDLCQNPSVCTRFFGRPDAATREGELLQGSPSGELLDAMFAVSDGAMAKGNLKNAIHVLLVLASVATAQKDIGRSREAMTRVLRCINPALAHCVHPSQTNRNEVLDLTVAVKVQLNLARADMVTPDVDAFYQLCTLMQFHQALALGETEAALSAFLALSFVPANLQAVDHKVRIFNTAITEEVVAAAPFALLAALKGIRSLYDSQSGAGEQRHRMKEHGQALLRWQSKWRYHLGHEQQQEIQQFDHLFSH